MAEAKKQTKNIYVQREEAVLDFWDKAETFRRSVDKDAPAGDYVFYDGPPFGTGEPHYGHLLSSIAKDVVPRYFTMRGYRVERRWGWDCHGLPIENIIEKEMGISGKKEIEQIGIAKFNEACRARVLAFAAVWETMIRRIGRWVEFKNSYKTMDRDFMESVWWGFKELWQKGLVYEGRRVLLYCPRCETPISNFEVAMDNSYKDIKETSVYVKFKLKNPEQLGAKQPTYILAWTTTPWTLPANVALAVGADIKYSLVRPDSPGGANELLIVAAERLAVLSTKYEIIKELTGQDLVGLDYEPLYESPALAATGQRAHYVAAADFVTTTDGTGIVHTAVVYGEDDYNLGQKLGLPVVPVLDEKGVFNSNIPQFAGVYFKKADALVIKNLSARQLLYKTEEIVHSYPHCHRCDTQLFYNAIPALFINIARLRSDLLKQNENIHWYPAHLKNGRFRLGVEQAPDWNISRNRYFATPIPIWACGQCGHREIIGSVSELEAKSGQSDLRDIHRHFIDDLRWPCPRCGQPVQRIKEVFDCWVESGSMSFAQHHYPFANREKFQNNFPAQYISEYISQTRAWFYVMHVLSTALFQKNCFEHCAATGVILNDKGEKMSKSKKNFPDPWKVINEFGADTLRFYLMSSTLMHAENLFFNEQDLRDVFRQNIMILGNIYEFYRLYAPAGSSPQDSYTPPASASVLDQWLLIRLHELTREVTASMENYDLPRASRPITDFINDFSTWYLRRSRERLKTGEDADRAAALATMRYVLLVLAKIMAPFLPMTAEWLWQKITGWDFHNMEKSVHLESWPELGPAPQATEEIIRQTRLAREIIELGLSARDQANLKVRQPLARLTVRGSSLDAPYVGLIQAEVNVLAVVWQAGDQLSVELDTNITPALKLAGLKRELVRQINAQRKKANLTINDRITVKVSTNSADTRDALEKYSEQIKKETLADELTVDALTGGEELARIGAEEASIMIIKI